MRKTLYVVIVVKVKALPDHMKDIKENREAEQEEHSRPVRGNN